MNVLAGYIALLSIATTVVQIPYVDASSEAQAISMVALEIEVVEKTRKACGKLIPEAKRAFDYQALQWQLGNRTEIGDSRGPCGIHARTTEPPEGERSVHGLRGKCLSFAHSR